METLYSKNISSTVNGKTYYLRSYISYNTPSIKNTVLTVTGTVRIQAKGTFYNATESYKTYGDVYIGEYKSGSYWDPVTAKTSNITIFNADKTYSDWTTLASKSFELSMPRTHSARSIRITTSPHLTNASTYPAYPTSNAGIATVSLPALASYKVTYNYNVEGAATDTQTKWYGESLKLLTGTPTRASYTFWHWNTNTSNTGNSYSPGGAYNTNAALTLYAIWNPYIYYNANGGSGAPSTQSKTFGTNLTLSSTTPTRNGYQFQNWNTKADGTGTTYSPSDTYTSNSTATLYAQWKSYPKSPTISNMTALRWDFTEDEPSDTATGAKVSLSWSVDLTSQVYGDTNSGTVTLAAVPQSGSSSPTITAVSGTTGTSGTAVFNVTNADSDMQYYITATVTDVHSSSSKTVILTRAYFIMDFKAGGEAIGIGRAAPSTGLEIGYTSTFDDDVNFYDDVNIRLVSGVMRGIVDYFYPVGSYYETSLPYAIPSGSSSPTAEDLALLGVTWFHPSYAWPGTWSLEAEGIFHVSAGSSADYLIGATGGEDKHQLIESELPKVTGSFRIRRYETSASNTGAVATNVSGVFSSKDGSETAAAMRVSSATNTGNTQVNLSFGNNGVHENRPPYTAVNRWHRTA